MRTTLVVCLFLATLLHAESKALFSSAAPTSASMTAAPVGSTHLIANATTPSSPADDDDKELAKIAASCLTREEHEHMTGDMLRDWTARFINGRLVPEAQKAIGLVELRSVAGFAPPGPWTAYREPTEDEIAAAPTVEEYYELREPRSEDRSLDSGYLVERNLPPAIDFLDARFPAIRAIYRRKFEAIRRRHEDAKMRIDRNEVDEMIEEYITTSRRVRDAITVMIQKDDWCW